MHLVPAERQHHHALDGERVCEAIGAMGEPADVAAWASRFKIMADPSRLALLLGIAAAGPISVTDLATAAGLNDTTVSQALRLLRATGTVTGRRQGRVIRYELADPQVAWLLTHVKFPRGAQRLEEWQSS